MREILETVKYKGFEISICPDSDTESPDAWGDDNLFLTGYHRDFTVKSEIVTKEECQSLLNKNPEEYGVGKYRYKELLKKYHVFGLEAYIHGGVALSISYEVNFPDRQWDVSHLGCVFVAKSEWRTRKQAHKSAKVLIETWNQYLSGDVYGYMVEPDLSGCMGSCWGFYGEDGKKEMIAEAKSEIDCHIDSRKRESAKSKILHKESCSAC